VITSVRNPKIQMVRNLLDRKRKRDDAQSFIVEGIRLAEEALSAGIDIDLVLFSSNVSARGQQIIDKLTAKKFPIEEVDPRILDRLSDTQTCQGLILICQKPVISSDQFKEPLLLLDQVRDPGNLGTILRSALAFGFGNVLLTYGSVDPYSPKVLRAAMGAQFSMPIGYRTPQETHSICKSRFKPPLQIVLADARAERACWEVDLSIPICLVVGGEAFGASPAIEAIINTRVSIPMQASSESLNAAMAGNILMYEVFRQRKTR